ncbi:hypothetical protein J7E24_07160 [Hymenobacter sp. ISL-91]|uniref:hypothetical protein n=1 Tax=Hymenobacter sp. ISL-91 TaxID=2819151 RepID=UPI001BE6F7A3|nr:hypothetical protein [Hymenobacter sp. ISL-91]MBT2557556.1 hypothetical protein [Hymenobacter sp. ISL-91]
MPEVYTKQEVDELLAEALAPILKELAERRAGAGVIWVDQQEAMKLTGRSVGWFYQNRTNGKLPIALMPPEEGSQRLRFSYADCVAYGRKHGHLPPAHLMLD